MTTEKWQHAQVEITTTPNGGADTWMAQTAQPGGGEHAGRLWLATLSAAGDQGWELVTVVLDGNGRTWAFFKRPAVDDDDATSDAVIV